MQFNYETSDEALEQAVEDGLASNSIEAVSEAYNRTHARINAALKQAHNPAAVVRRALEERMSNMDFD